MKRFLIIVGAAIYFLSPIDLIPDLLPPLTYVDDAAVVVWAIRKLYSNEPSGGHGGVS